MIAVEDVRHTYPGTPPVPVLDGVTLAVPDGGFGALVGPSGCGKSTLLRMLAGLERPDAGSVAVDGSDVAGRPGATAWLPQRDLLLPWRRAVGNAALGAEVAGIPRAEARAAARARFAEFGLAGFERAWPGALSGGMRQRLAFLRAFLTPRPTLLLDEPFGALDAITRRDLQQWLAEVWAHDRRTVLLVTHDVDEALWLADEVTVLSARPGRVLARVPSPFPRPRPAGLVTDPAFVAAKAEILAVLERGIREGAVSGGSSPASP